MVKNINTSRLPVDYDKLVSTDDLELDPYNIREEEPTNELVENIRETGFREAIIVRLKGKDEKYYVTDGWQRVLAGIRAGEFKIPVKIYIKTLDALKEARRASMKKEWTKYQEIIQCRNYYNLCKKEEGLFRQEAIEKTSKDNSITKRTVIKYLNVTKLPQIVQSLLKIPKNRDQDEIDKLEKISYTIKSVRKKLRIDIAEAIARSLNNFPLDIQCKIAIKTMSLRTKKALKAIDLISKNPEKNPFEIISKVDKGYKKVDIFSVGDLIIGYELKNKILQHCAKTGLHYKELIKELLKDWSLASDSSITTPNNELMMEIGQISFMIQNYLVKIIQMSGKPTIKIEGNPTVFYSYSEVHQKAWNDNTKIPKYLKDFLNELNIKLVKKKLNIENKEALF